MIVPGHARILTPLGPTAPRRPTPAGWHVACKCGWDGGRSETRKPATDAFATHRKAAMPTCRRCGEPKPRRDMSKGSPHLCKPCRNAATRAWYEANPSEWERHRRRSHLKRKYGITEDVYEALLGAQGGACGICGVRTTDSRGFRPHIDHCHRTGKIRGILCGPCNQGIGNLGDDPDRLRKALAYLLRHQGEE